MKKLAVLLLAVMFALTVSVTASAATAISPESDKPSTGDGSDTDKSDKTADMGVIYISAAMLSSAAAGVVAKKKLSK